MGSERIANRLSSRRFSKKRTKVPYLRIFRLQNPQYSAIPQIAIIPQLPICGVILNCDKCNGKLVVTRTKMLHEAAENTTDSNLNSGLASLLLINQEEDSTITSLEENPINEDILISPLNEEISVITPFEEDSTTIPLNEKDNSTTPEYNENEYIFLPRSRTRSYANRPQIMLEHSGTEDLSNSDYEQHTDTSSSDGNESDDGTFADTFENYSPPDFKSYQEEEKTTIDDKFSWILLWMMTFRKKFNLPETATESQLKFMKIVLKEIGGDIYDSFPDSLYLARIQLGLKDRFHSFVPCPKCHKLYNKTDMDEIQKNDSISIIRCSHVKFPNSASRRTKSCQTVLAEREVKKPELIYPFVPIHQQLEALYRRPHFERLLRHWSNHRQFDNILTDIYDGQIWKTFRETDDENSAKFFRPEVADSHLGLMINLDWFQPYDGTFYSIGVIYAAICNLPRNIRFKRENLLVLGLLPGLNEVSLHKINHYIAPIVNELELLWSGITLNRTFECQNGKIFVWRIWRIGSLLAIRPNIVGMLLHGEVAIPPIQERISLVKKGLDGIARWIMKRIWIDKGVLTPNDLKKIQEKMNQFKIPADLG
ncbi:uncharacterized protein LOC114460739 [Rhizophagus irregularis DAOM 181602=DAOM 197198]|nr:uncharacterized protein LOC114460739 [Rhizophagus irregularis DAOM 181602=DAOM 197198]